MGNLLLVPKGKNTQLSNQSFAQKREIYKVGSYSENVVAKEIDWTPKTISERGRDMLAFMEKRWSIELKESDKRKLLLLGSIRLL